MVGRYASQSGYVALLSVLIMGAVAAAVGVSLLTSGVDSQRTSLVELQSKQAKAAAVSCAQEALQIVHDSTTYTGTNGLSLSSSSCTYAVTNSGGNERIINTTGTAGNVVKKVQVYVTIGSSSISVTSWQEVA